MQEPIGLKAHALKPLPAAGGANAVNVADEDGWTCLLSASSAGHPSVVQTLLGAGADPLAVNSTKRTALHYAASKGHVEVIKLLVQAGACLSSRRLLQHDAHGTM